MGNQVIAHLAMIKDRSDALLTAMLGKDLVEQWWQGENKRFDGLTPAEQWEKDPEGVYSYLMNMSEGEW
jgi:hypothetical protein